MVYHSSCVIWIIIKGKKISIMWLLLFFLYPFFVLVLILLHRLNLLVITLLSWNEEPLALKITLYSIVFFFFLYSLLSRRLKTLLRDENKSNWLVCFFFNGGSFPKDIVWFLNFKPNSRFWSFIRIREFLKCTSNYPNEYI